MLNILIVDDSTMARKRIIETLENLGIKHTVIAQVKDGHEGLNEFQKETPDLLITDLEMPNMNGMELIKEIRILDNSVHIIVISSLINEEIRQTLKHDRFLDFIKKPINDKILKTVLQKVEHHIKNEVHL